MFQRSGKGLSINMQRAINSLRCMFVGAGDHLWELIGGLYYFYKWRGYTESFESTLNYVYQYVCTCRELADEFTTTFGGDK